MKIETSKIGELIVAWLASRRDGAGTEAELTRALASFGAHLPDWRPQVLDAAEKLVAEALLARKGKRLQLTNAGRKRALAVLGVDALPSRVDWGKIKSDYLTPRMMGLPSATAGLSADALRVAVIARGEGLATTAGKATRANVENALVWKALGIDSIAPLTKKALLTHVLGRALEGARVRDPEKALAQLAAKHVGARRADAAAVREAIARRWLDGAEAEVAGPAQPPKDLATFTKRVVEAAREAVGGRHGDRKVFIGQVHRQLGAETLPLDAFKARLVEAQRAGLLTLSRADLVEAMSPEEVRASETVYLGEQFHFVRLPEETSR